jgi:AraC-like DNA-binding protein
LLQGTGITQADLDNPDALITPLQEQAFFRNWLVQAGRADCGLDVGSRYRLMHFGHLGLLMPHAATRRQAIELFLRFINLSYTHFQPEADLRAGHLRLTGGERLGGLRRFYLDRDVAFTVKLAREFFKDGAVPPLHVSFDYPLPSEGLARYASALGLPVRFGARWTEVAFDTTHLDEAMPEANALLVRMLQPQCEARTAQVVGHPTLNWAQRVQQVLAQHGQSGPWPDSTEVARRLRCSERSLRRHLAQEGVRFQALSDQVRSERARHSLRRPDTTLDDIARDLGYSEAAAFIRAYKRWFGRPPGEDRHS